MNMATRVAMLALVCLGACTTSPQDRVLYCGPDGGASGKMRIDLGTLTISGADTSAMVKLFSNDSFVGFTNPFPMLVFEPSIDPKTLSAGTSAEGYLFTFQSLQSDERDWWLITARPDIDSTANGKTTSRMTSAVVYSLADGVLAINTSPLGEGRQFSSNYVPCGPKALSYADLYRASQTVAPQ